MVKIDVDPMVNWVRTDPITFERMLIRCIIQSMKFYRAHRDVLCPRISEKRGFRLDFATPRFNNLYEAVDYYFRTFDNSQWTDDMAVPRQYLEEIIIDRINKGIISQTQNPDLDAPTANIWAKRQHLFVEKATKGPGGTWPVLQQFQFQRFRDWKKEMATT